MTMSLLSQAGCGTGLSTCIASTSTTRAMPAMSAIHVGYARAKPATMSRTRSIFVVLRNAQPWKPAASAAMPMAAVTVTSAIDHQLALASAFVEPISSRPCPLGSSTNMKGSRNAGTVYFQHCIVVLYGSPPVIAAAANGDGAVGGDTSDST